MQKQGIYNLKHINKYIPVLTLYRSRNEILPTTPGALAWPFSVTIPFHKRITYMIASSPLSFFKPNNTPPKEKRKHKKINVSEIFRSQMLTYAISWLELTYSPFWAQSHTCLPLPVTHSFIHSIFIGHFLLPRYCS